MIIFLVMNSMVFFTAVRLALGLFKVSNPVDSLIAVFILYFSQIISTELLLGIYGVLSLHNLLLVNTGVCLLAFWLTKGRVKWPDFVGAQANFRSLSGNRVGVFLISVIGVFAVFKLAINLVNPPFGWDSLNYHFPFAVEWLKHGNLQMPITVSDDPSPPYYPINGSLFYLWLIFPFRNVFLADLGQAPFFMLSILAVFSLARKLGIQRDYSFYAAALFLLIPNFFKQLSIAYVDVMIAALFLAALHFIFLLARDFSLANVLLYSMSFGLFLGTKTTALPYGVLLFVPFLWIISKNMKKAYFLPFAFLVIAALGGFTYIRNFLETSNPLYPLDLKLFGQTIFKGVMSRQIYAAHFKPQDYQLSKLLFHEGLGAQTLLFVLPFVFLGLPIAVWRKPKSVNFILAYFLLLPGLLYLVYRYVIPLANTRYLYPLLGVGMISGFFSLTSLDIRRWLVNLLVTLCALASVSELAKRGELILSVVFTFAVFLLWAFFGNVFLRKVFFKKTILVSSVFAIIIISSFLAKDYQRNEFSRYKLTAKSSGFWMEAIEAWQWLDRNTGGDNIAYIGRPVPFPLYGTNFKNNVSYISVNKVEPARLHYFPDSRYQWGYDFLSLHRNLQEPQNYRGNPDYSAWLANLKSQGIAYLFVYALHQTKTVEFPLEDTWASSNPDRFTPVFSNSIVHIYKLNFQQPEGVRKR